MAICLKFGSDVYKLEIKLSRVAAAYTAGAAAYTAGAAAYTVGAAAYTVGAAAYTAGAAAYMHTVRIKLTQSS